MSVATNPAPSFAGIVGYAMLCKARGDWSPGSRGWTNSVARSAARGMGLSGRTIPAVPITVPTALISFVTFESSGSPGMRESQITML